MLDSTELRWFFQGHIPEEIKNTFFSNTSRHYESRSDYYFVIRNCDYLGIKIRNRRLEIKWKRSSNPFYLSEHSVEGNIEFWTRWEWNDTSAYYDTMNFLTMANVVPCIRVEKKRFQKKFVIQGNKFLELPPENPWFDVAMEITELKINGDPWWSIGFDLIQSDDKIPILYKMVEEQGLYKYEIKLIKNNSFGYPSWLSGIYERVKY